MTAPMSAHPPRALLFLSHSASLNGASVLLLHLLRWLRAHTDFRLEVLCDEGGPLLADFRDVATTHLWRGTTRLQQDGSAHWLQSLGQRLAPPVLRNLLRHGRPDLVYANTAAVWPQVAALARADMPLLWHIHELPYALDLTLPAARARALLARAARVVAVSGDVQDALARGYAVERSRVDVVHGFVPMQAPLDAQRAALRTRILAGLGWPADAFVVGACGGPGWRKGSDLFLQIAALAGAGAAGRPLRFLWVGGGDASTIEGRQFAHDLVALGIASHCVRVPATAEVAGYYSAMDVFALTSREDPYPLVMLEAGVHGLPLLCFAGSGGGPEFAAGDAGIVLPYLDLAGFAREIGALAAAPRRRDALGAAAREKVVAGHGLDAQCAKLLGSIERGLAAA